MTHFSFKAISAAGDTYTGAAEAEDKYALARRLKQDGDTLISVEDDDAKTRAGMAGLLARARERLTHLGGVSLRDKIVFARNLAAMVSGGLSLSRALGVLERQTRNATFKATIRAMDERVRQGTTLSAAVLEHPRVFPPVFSAMVKAGEESGTLAAALENLATQMKKTYELKRRVRGAMIYPAIIITAMIGVGITLLLFVVPTLTATFEELDVELPKSTQFVIAVSDLLKNHTVLFFGGLAVLIAGAIAAARRPRGKRAFEWALFRIPVIGEMVRQTNAAATARTLSSLLVSGVEIVSAVGITRAVIQNSYFKAVLAEAETAIPKGGAIAASFVAHEALYPPLLGEMVAVGEEAGNLPEMLSRVADFYEGEVDERTKNLSTVIEPILMIIIGSVVGFFALSMISPIYSLSNVI